MTRQLTIKTLIVSLLAAGFFFVQSTAEVQAAPVCANIGNNLAVQFGRGGTKFDEAAYTLASLEGRENIAPIISAINSSPGTIIIRLGASTTSLGPEDPLAYAGMLREIAAAVGGKPFIAMAGHNEPNCAEDIPLAEETEYVTSVVNDIKNSEFSDQITLITGQIDFYCGSGSGPAYLQRLTSIDGIEGVALPFYITDGTPTAGATIDAFKRAVADTNGLPIYVTESGPLRAGSMAEFVNAVSQLDEPNIVTFLLFNALGINTEFGYTRPFWNPACREAFRTSCADPEKVLEACGTSTDADDAYYYPIEGLAERDTNKILNNLVDQGYQVQCTTPKFQVEVVQGGAIEKFISLVDQGRANPIDRTVTSSLVYDLTQVQVPIWRSSSASNSNPSLFTSLQNYWSVHEPIDSEQPEELIKASPVFRLLTPEQRCRYQVHLLETIENMCGLLADPTKCALYEPIPKTDYTTQTLLDDIRSSSFSCDLLAGKTSFTDSQERVRTALANSPLYLNNAYRLAFLVVSAELKDDPSPLRFFNFLRPDRSSNPRHEIRVIAFKIPDIGTNKAPGNLNYSDPIQITRDSITDLDVIRQRKEDFEQEKTRLKTGGEPGIIPAIECGGENCNDPLTKALTDIINRSGASCEANPQDLEYEPTTGIIQSSGQITSGPGTEFADGSDPAKNLLTSPADQTETPQRATFQFLSDLKLGVRGSADTKVKAFLVIPTGHELETSEDALTAFFNYDWVEEVENNPNIKNYFRLGGVDARFTSAKVTASFNDPEAVPCPNTGSQLTPEDLLAGLTAEDVANRPDSDQPCFNTNDIEAEIKAQQNDTEPRILGGKLGFLTRKIQETLRDVASPQFKALEACETTEQFLTGQCSGALPGTGVPGGDGGIEFPGGPGSGSGSGRGCEVVPSGPCSVSNLSRYFTNSGGYTAEQKASYASIICNRESAGNSQARNLSCTRGTGGTDYSVGLFQVNMLAHCPGAFQPWQIGDPVCTIQNSAALQACVNNMLDPDKNIQKMVSLSSRNGTRPDGTYWWHWQTVSNDCNIPLTDP